MPTNWGDTVATMDKGLKTDELNMRMIDAIYHGSRVMKRFSKNKPRFIGGKSSTAYWPVDSEQGFGFAALAEGGVHALAYPDYQQIYSLTLADFSASMEVTRKAISVAKKRGASYLGDLTARKLKKVVNNIQFFLAARVFQGNSALLGTATSSNPLDGILTADGNGDMVKWLRRGMRVTVQTAATDQLTNPSDGTTDGGRIIAIDREAKTFTIADDTGLSTATSYDIYLVGTYGQSTVQGVQHIISQSGTFQGQVRTTAGLEFAKAWRVNGGGSALTTEMLMQARNRVPEMSPSAEVDNCIILCSHETTVDINKLTESRLRYSDPANRGIGFKGGKNNGGTGLMIHTGNGPTEVVPDRFCIEKTIYLTDPGDYHWCWPEGQEGGKWFDEDGNVLKAKTDTAGRRADALQAHRDVRVNLANDNPQNQVLLDNFLTPS